MEDTAWKENEDPWILPLAGIATVTGTVQAMRKQNVYNQEAAGDGADEEDCTRNLSQAWPFRVPDVRTKVSTSPLA